MKEKNKKLYNDIKAFLIDGKIQPYHIDLVPEHTKPDLAVGDNSIIAYPVQESYMYNDRYIGSEDFVYIKDNEINPISKYNISLYSEIPSDLKDVYSKASRDLGITEKTPDELIYNAIKEKNLLAVPVKENEANFYKDALSSLNIANTYLDNGYLVVKKSDELEARAAISAIRSLSEKEREIFEKSKDTFENRYEAEIAKIKEQNKTIDSVKREENDKLFLPKKLKLIKEGKEVIDVENVSSKEIQSAIHDDKVADVGTATHVHDAKVEEIAENVNSEEVLDEQLAYSPREDDESIMTDNEIEEKIEENKALSDITDDIDIDDDETGYYGMPDYEVRTLIWY